MSDRMLWRYGDTNPAVAAVGSSTVIEIGDLLWQDTNQAKPASMLPIDKPGQLAVNMTPDVVAAIDDALEIASFSDETQGQFVEAFLGVAMQRSRAGDTDPVRVATTGVFEFDCVETDFELGDLFGPAQPGMRTVLCNQSVEKVSAAKYAIGRCAKRGATLASVLVDIRS